MRKYERLEVWDAIEADSGVRLNVFPPNDVLALTDQLRMDGRDKLTATVRRESSIWASVLDRRILRVVEDDQDFTEWRISKIGQDESVSSGIVGVLEAQSIRQDLLDGVLDDTLDNNDVIHEFEMSQTPSDLITNFILPAAKTYFALGTIDPTDLATLTVDWDSPLSALQQIAKITDSRLAVRRNGTTNYLIDLLIDSTPANPSSEIRVGKNVIGVKHERNTDKLATRVYPRGEAIEEIRMTMAEAVWKVVSVSADDVILIDPNSSDGPIAFDNQLNTLQFKKVNGNISQITDSVFSSQQVTLVNTTDVAANDLIKIRLNTNKDQLTFLDSPADIITLGVVSRVLDRPDIPFVQNLVANPQFSGTYASGLAPNWNKVSPGGTATENTLTKFQRRDGQSQKFVVSADGEGIESDAITIAPTGERPQFSAYFTLWIVKGRIRFEWVDVTNGKLILSGSEGKNHSSETNVWVDFGLAGPDLNKEGTLSVKLRIVVDGNQDTEFYLDSAQLTQSAGHLPFFAGDGALKLWKAANDELIVRGVPETVITVNIVDLFRFDPTAWPYDELILADSVRAIGPNISLDVITRIVDIRHNILDDGVVGVILSNRPEDLTDALFRTRRRFRIGPNVDGRFDDPRIADPSIGPEQVNVTTITYPISFDPETVRIEVFSREDAASTVPVPGELAMYHAGTIIPGQMSFIIEGTSNFWRRTVFVAYDKTNIRGKTTSFGATQMVDSGTGPTAAPNTLACGTETTTTAPLTWINGDALAQIRIYQDGVIVETITAGDTSFTITGLSPGTDYNFQLDHFRNDQPSGKSNLVICTTDSLPPSLPVPTNFVATCSVGLGITFTWTNADSSAHTILERADNSIFTSGVIELQDRIPGSNNTKAFDEPEGIFYWRIFHRKAGFTDSVPTSPTQQANYFCTPA